jgi:hypothetical protein
MKLGIPYSVGNLSIRRDSCLVKKDSDPRSEQVRNCGYPVHKAGSNLVPNAHYVINSYITGSALELTTSSPCSLYSWNCVLIPNWPSSTVRRYSNLPGMSCEHLWHSLTRLLVYHLLFHIQCALYFDYKSTLILEGERTYISMHYFQTTERNRPDDRRDTQIKISLSLLTHPYKKCLPPHWRVKVTVSWTDASWHNYQYSYATKNQRNAHVSN